MPDVPLADKRGASPGSPTSEVECTSHGGHEYFQILDQEEYNALFDPEKYGCKTMTDAEGKASTLWAIQASVTEHIDNEYYFPDRRRIPKKDQYFLDFYNVHLDKAREHFSELEEWKDIALNMHCGRNKRLREFRIICQACGRGTTTLYPVHEDRDKRHFAALVIKQAFDPLFTRIRGGSSSASSALTEEEYCSRMAFRTEGGAAKRARRRHHE